MYVEPPAGDPARPLRHLAGFARADVAAGEEATVTVELDRRAFASWIDGDWVVAAGRARRSTSAATAATSATPASSPPDRRSVTRR